MSQNHALKMILSHSLIFIFIFSKQYMVLQSECLRVNLQNSPLDPLKNRFLRFSPLESAYFCALILMYPILLTV
jgi:hypothetical protein